MTALLHLVRTHHAALLAQWCREEPHAICDRDTTLRELEVALREGHARASSAPGASGLRDALFDLVEREGIPLTGREARVLARFFADSDVRASEVELRAVTDAIPVLLAYVTSDQRYGLVNKAYESWFALRRDQILGRTLADVIEAPAYELLRGFVERGIAGERVSFEQHDVPYRLGPRDIRTEFIPRFDADGKPSGYFSLIQDITAERRAAAEREQLLAREKIAHAEAQAERAKLHALFMQAPVAIAILDGRDHVFTLANPAYRALVDGRDVVGKPLAEALPDVTGQGFDTLLTQVMDTGVPYIGNEVVIPLAHHQAGETLILNFVYTPKRNAAGEVDGVLMSGLDVTAQVIARQRSEALGIQLQHSREAEAELRRIAEQANRAKDEFLAMLGHEMRNPLAPISTALELMRMSGHTAFAKERQIIERQVAHLSGLVDDLLDVSRITSGKVELARERLAIDVVVARAVEIASPLIEQRRHHLRVDVPPHLDIDGDPLRLAQVVSNLLTNAAKYTDPGGQIDVTATATDAQIVLTVRDNGTGIARETLPHVFDLFVQEQQSIERARGGLGLGLTIVRTLVELHGGTVSAHSEGQGTGSAFTLRLPRASIAARPQVRPVISHEPAAAGTRILIVDDNADAADLLGEALGGMGNEIRVAYDGPAALRAVETFAPDIALLDIGLPAMDGYELARELRKRPALDHTRLIALTGYGQASDRELTRAAGFDAHLVKPIRFDELRRLLRTLTPR